MLPYPEIDPVMVHIGPVSVHWYGFMYLLGFVASYLLVRRQIFEGAQDFPPESREELVVSELKRLDELLFYLVLGVILGGRLGYVIFYNLPYYLRDPKEILAVWHGGMSFHGGTIGAISAGWLYCRIHGLDFWKWSDRFVVTAPIGLGLGRIGNFINGELFGRPTDVPWAMVFPQGGPVPRHPSQIYEALLEGVLLFIILWPLRLKPWPKGKKSALFLILYAVFRITVEFFREPDPQLGYILWGWVTMGQILSLAFLIFGLFLWWFSGRREKDDCFKTSRP
jgi:phosphatidylglycerol:prolipoprotein diacylglycerol transferase